MTVWRTVSIGDVCERTEQRDPRREPDAQIQYIDISGIDRSHKVVAESQPMLGADAPSRARKVVRAGDILVSTVRPNLNAVAVVPDDLDGEIASTGFCVLRPNKNVTRTSYLFYRTISPDFVTALSARVKGANYPAVTDDDVREMTLPLPPLSEQHRIVEILEQADHLRRLRTEASTKANRILPALFLKMFGDPATNPMGWPQVSLAEIATEMKYGTSTRCDVGADGVPVLRIPNVVSGAIDLEDLKFAHLEETELEKLQLGSGDLLFVRTNGNPDYVGRCAVFDIPGRYAFASYLIRASLDGNRVEPGYVAAFLATPMGRSALAPFIRTTAGQSNISTAGLRQVPIPLPPIDLQREFQGRAAKVQRVAEENLESRDSLDGLFRVLLSRAFSGVLTESWRIDHAEHLAREAERQAAALAESAS